ncbi:MAG: endonuclease [Bacteroidaceae bacterium]|nr:endonuclease [Bacteroidaceae bacterium]
MKAFFLFLFLIPAVSVPAQSRFRVMTYNVENLFDTRHDTLKNDDEFLPEGERKWDSRKYWDKLQKIAKVIAAVGEEQLPDLVALCEVENDSCLTDLTRRSVLRRAGYRYVMTQSRDARGVDVALLYQPARFRPLLVENIDVHPEEIGQKPTRDILHVTGLLQSSDTLDVYVCHMPSRGGGKEETEPFRIHTASLLRTSVDVILKERKLPRLLIMGDFNDYPHDRSLSQALKAQRPAEGKGNPSPKNLYNLSYEIKSGTYRYQGEWNTLDHLIVTGNMLPARGRVFMPEWLLEKDNTYGGYKPFRTYQGPRYLGGYSDHLPVFADLDL